jgi:hypothetical protein
MNLKPVLNKTSPHVHMELEFDMLGVPKKLVKYVEKEKYLEEEKLKTIIFLHTSCQTAID